MSDLSFTLLIIAIICVSGLCVWAIGLSDFFLIVLTSFIDAFFDD